MERTDAAPAHDFPWATDTAAAETNVRPPVLGRYHLRGRLGAGAFGTVYRAYDPQLDREVALKVPRPEALEDGETLVRFCREARAAARLHHPHIVPVYEAVQDGALAYIASAFVPGQPLTALIPAGGMDPRRAALLAAQLAEALAYAHRQGVLHRDVKPDNVLVDERDHLYLTDFGLAALAQQPGTRLTQHGTVLGTPSYMAPEQIEGEIGQMGPWSDQYSVGVTLYQLLTGRLPFVADNNLALLYRIMQEPFAPPSRHRPGLDPRLEAICLKALARQRAERYGDCQELADALRQWAAAPAAAARPAAAGGEPGGPAGLGWWAGLVGVAVTACAAGLGLLAHQQRGPGPAAPGAAAPPSAALVMREERPAEGEYRNSIGMRLVSLPAGEFWMGSADGAGARADETPRHRVRLTRPFSLGACEVTAGQYARVLGRAAEGDPDLPAVNVSWDDAVAFCRALSALPDEKAAGRIYRLPTEAEWEYACRAGTTTAYHTGDHLSSRQAQFGQAGPWAVGQGAPNAWGLYDLHGNVWEWCFDAYTADYYRHAPPADPRGLSGGPTRVLRGGGWDAPAADCRSAARRAARPGMRHPAVGFRVAVAE